ncbi:hypothetical protein [Marinigracilibium pacificum]|uniref:Uncharacterized protein n=1 Tax=Marinigracilibium pacificum TaxID=2729599 RepID=A0A848J3V9_9BACT|nr:hypothetical protein [Marinigracilibium pacificum]NMM50008.1 hypothetical protein [Marinigracilibium pacificum]
MPKGEHFKKNNPRIHQVSFKVNATELSELKQILAKEKMGMAEWFRSQITVYSGSDNPVVKQKEVKQTIVKTVEPPKVEQKKVSTAPKPNKPAKKNQVEESSDQSQMSLF